MRWLGILLALIGAAATALPACGQTLSTSLQTALEYNRTRQSSTWIDPDAAAGQSVMPVLTFAGRAGQPCREFITTVTVAGRFDRAHGTACRQPDGHWQLVAGSEVRLLRTGPPRTVYLPTAPPIVYGRYYGDPWAYPWGCWSYLPVALSFGWFDDGGWYHGGHGDHHPRGERPFRRFRGPRRHR